MDHLIFFRGMEPRDFFISPEPGHLPFRILTRICLDGLNCLVKSRFIFEIIEYLCIPYSLQRIFLLIRTKPLHFLFQSELYHFIYPQGDILAKLFSWQL